MNTITCTSLTRDFGEVRALDRLTLAVPQGAVFAFLGANGAGKTTTIHLLLGLIEPTSGSARVLGLDPAADGFEVRHRAGALLEHSGIYERLTAEENLRFYARLVHLGREEGDARIGELLTHFGLWERRGDLAGTFSRGMKQKLAIARVLLHRPSIVFLDEPTAGLDPEATVALRRDIVRLGESATVFLTTHNLADAEKMATLVGVIRGGRLLDVGTPAEVRRRGIRSRVVITLADGEQRTVDLDPGQRVAPIVRELVTGGAEIEEVRREEPSLEDAFLHLVRGGDQLAERAGEAMPPPPRRRREPIFRDVAAVVRKDWLEMTAAASGFSGKATLITSIIAMGVLAAIAAMIGPKLIESPSIAAVTAISFVMLLATVSDSFAGERERHTLETLLASPIPDEALLFGKIAGNVAYGWLLALVLLLVMLIGANLPMERFAFFRPSVILTVLVATPLSLVFIATLGVLLSLRSATVREAQSRVAILLLVLFLPFAVFVNVMPDEWRIAMAASMSTELGRLQATLGQIGVLAIVDVALLTWGFVRFRRSRLI